MRPQLMHSECYPSSSFYWMFPSQILTFSKLISSMVSLNNGRSNSAEQVANSASLNNASNSVFSFWMSCFRLVRYAQRKFKLKLLHKFVILFVQTKHSLIKYYSSIYCSAKFNTELSLTMYEFSYTSIFFLHITINGKTVSKMLRCIKYEDYQQQCITVLFDNYSTSLLQFVK